MRAVLPVLILAGCQGPLLLGSPAFEVGPAELAVFDLFEARVPAYTDDAALSGRFQRAGETALIVEGFREGRELRLRFMPSKFGEHVFALTLRYGGRAFEQRGSFRAKEVRRRGPLRVDTVYPWHFVWEGTGERFLWNGVGGDGLLGLDEAAMRKAVERLASLRVTHLRLRAEGGVALEKVIRAAREKDVVVGLKLPADGQRESVARWAAFSNVTWELPDAGAGPILKGLDPYGRLAMGAVGRAAWVDVAFHGGGGGGHGFVREARREQEGAGRILPQVVEGAAKDDEGARGWAWEVAMAGGYGSVGEVEKAGLQGRAWLMEFLAAAEAWRLEPRDDLVRSGAYCLAEPGRRYVVYQPEGREATLGVEPGRYRVRRYDPRTGAWEQRPPAEGAQWTAPASATPGDWAWILDRS